MVPRDRYVCRPGLNTTNVRTFVCCFVCFVLFSVPFYYVERERESERARWRVYWESF